MYWAAHMRGRVRPKTLDGYQGLIRLYALPALPTPTRVAPPRS